MIKTLHRELCEAAQAWLLRPASRSGPGCRVAFSEVQTHDTAEVADAIGFRTSDVQANSILIEVKVSRSDFLADKKKPHRNGERPGLGTFRYYLAPVGLLKVKDLPPRWGLIEVGARPRFRILAGHLLDDASRNWKLTRAERWAQILSRWGHVPDREREVGLLTQMLARVGDPGKLNDMLKEASAARSRLGREVDRLRAENRKLVMRVGMTLMLAQSDDESVSSTDAALEDVGGWS